MVYLEKHFVKIIAYPITIMLVVVTAIMVILLFYLPEGTWPILLAFELPMLILLVFVDLVFSRFEVRIDDKGLSFGYRPFMVKVPLEEIKQVSLQTSNFWTTGGIGVRYGYGSRWNYVAFWGPLVEIDWGCQRKHGFSTKSPDRVMAALARLIGKEKIIPSDIHPTPIA